MLTTIAHLNGSTIAATDGEIGHVKEAYFDDESWVIRYLVVDAGSWLTDRKVLISPYAIRLPLAHDKTIAVNLTREQVRKSPDIDTHQPVSRRHEREYLSYYAYPDYWVGDGLWAMGGLPVLPGALAVPPAIQEAEARRAAEAEAKVPPEDVHLRSSHHVAGYDIQALDGSIGHVKDFVFDDASWAIRYLLIDTRNWWPGGRKVLIGTRWIERIDWGVSTVSVNLSREQIRASPEFDDAAAIDRAYEQRLHDAYGRQGYWD